jgi:hypothetical protein
MEHVIQFGIGIDDDDAIRKRIEDGAEAQILKNIEDGVRSTLFEKDYYGRGYSKVPTSYLDKKIDAFFEAHKDEIIDIAATKLADRLARSKRGKEILEGLADEGALASAT